MLELASLQLYLETKFCLDAFKVLVGKFFEFECKLLRFIWNFYLLKNRKKISVSTVHIGQVNNDVKDLLAMVQGMEHADSVGGKGREMLWLNWNNWNDSGPSFRIQTKVQINQCL